MGGWGIFASLPTLLVVPSIRALFISLIMATNITNFGVINYNDHHKEVNINAENNNTAEIIRAFMNDNEIEEHTLEAYEYYKNI